MAEARGKGTSLRSVANLWVRPLQSRKPSFVLGLLDWRKREDSNLRYGYPHTRFPSVLLKPLGHTSA